MIFERDIELILNISSISITILLVMEEKNQTILKLLEDLQNYIKVMSNLQEVMSDGYFELAQSRKYSSLFILPEASENPRKIFKNSEEIEPEPEAPIVPGISCMVVKKVKNSWEKALPLLIEVLKIRSELDEQFVKTEKLVNNS